MITRSSIAFEDFLGSSIVPQVMPPCIKLNLYIIYRFVWGSLVLADMNNINIQASASLSQSVLSYYTVLIHILYGQGHIIQVSIL